MPQEGQSRRKMQVEQICKGIGRPHSGSRLKRAGIDFPRRWAQPEYRNVLLLLIGI
jgi:hypothetical protein